MSPKILACALGNRARLSAPPAPVLHAREAKPDAHTFICGPLQLVRPGSPKHAPQPPHGAPPSCPAAAAGSPARTALLRSSWTSLPGKEQCIRECHKLNSFSRSTHQHMKLAQALFLFVSSVIMQQHMYIKISLLGQDKLFRQLNAPRTMSSHCPSLAYKLL